MDCIVESLTYFPMGHHTIHVWLSNPLFLTHVSHPLNFARAASINGYLYKRGGETEEKRWQEKEREKERPCEKGGRDMREWAIADEKERKKKR